MNKENLIYRFTKISVSDKKMSNFLYAIFMTNATLQSHFHLGLEKYTRKQNGGNMVDVVICLKEDMINKFEELADVSLHTSDEFQGTMKLNNINDGNSSKL
jgi:hypothetical protein